MQQSKHREDNLKNTLGELLEESPEELLVYCAICHKRVNMNDTLSIELGGRGLEVCVCLKHIY